MNSLGMTVNNWLPLNEYANKYKVSISTLRRRIKAKEVKYLFREGKYFIMDNGSASHLSVEHRPSLNSDFQPLPSDQEPLLNAANRLLQELKKAYTQILDEKDHQIRQLKAEAADLKTLVQLLEMENEKLKKINLS